MIKNLLHKTAGKAKKGLHLVHFTFSHNLTLIQKLMFTYTLLIILPLTLLTFFSYRNVSQKLVTQFEYTSDNILQQTATYLDKILSDIMYSAAEVSTHTALAEISKPENTARSLPDIYGDFQTARSMIDSYFRYSNLYSIELFIDRDDYFTLSESSGGQNTYFIYLDTPFAKALDEKLVRFAGKLLWLPPRTITESGTGKIHTVITGARYIRDPDTHSVLGIATINIDQNYLNSIIRNSVALVDSFSLLIDANGNIMACSDHSKEFPPETIRNSLENRQTSVTLDNQTFLLNSVSINSCGWKLVTLLSYDEMLLTSRNTKNQMIIMMLLISCLFFVVAYYISILITSRIRALTNAMDNINFEQYTTLPDTVGTDEISSLTRHYNHLLERINEHAEARYLMGIQLKESELRALQAQINPHFLYNTLDLIHWISIDYDVPEITEIVSLLSRFYKLSLNHGDDIISVENAIKHLNIYFHLQNYRFNGALSLHLDLNPAVYEYRILNLLLQPVVENAILHGILEKEKPKGTITVSGNVINNILHFQITDDGVGMTSEQINNIMHLSNANSSLNTSDNGYGISNIRERIHIFYGEEYDIAYESQPGLGTTVHIMIPGLPMSDPNDTKL